MHNSNFPEMQLKYVHIYPQIYSCIFTREKFGFLMSKIFNLERHVYIANHDIQI